jgi:hypothetical protein
MEEEEEETFEPDASITSDGRASAPPATAGLASQLGVLRKMTIWDLSLPGAGCGEAMREDAGGTSTHNESTEQEATLD